MPLPCYDSIKGMWFRLALSHSEFCGDSNAGQVSTFLDYLTF
jgi:hypothetical protein